MFSSFLFQSSWVGLAPERLGHHFLGAIGVPKDDRWCVQLWKSKRHISSSHLLRRWKHRRRHGNLRDVTRSNTHHCHEKRVEKVDALLELSIRRTVTSHVYAAMSIDHCDWRVVATHVSNLRWRASLDLLRLLVCSGTRR